MKEYLREIREKIIKSGYEANKDIPKAMVVRAFEKPISIPSCYRILNKDNKNNEQKRRGKK